MTICNTLDKEHEVDSAPRGNGICERRGRPSKGVRKPQPPEGIKIPPKKPESALPLIPIENWSKNREYKMSIGWPEIGSRIYIAGKITDDPDYKKKFDAVAFWLDCKGHYVMNPSILPEGFAPDEYMHICKAMIDVCDAVIFLPDWLDSMGAKTEYCYARETKKSTYLFDALVKSEAIEILSCMRNDAWKGVDEFGSKVHDYLALDFIFRSMQK